LLHENGFVNTGPKKKAGKGSKAASDGGIIRTSGKNFAADPSIAPGCGKAVFCRLAAALRMAKGTGPRLVYLNIY
jgi:hypothetical protein